MAGGSLARQLKLAHPELAVIVVDKKAEFDYWIGESTVEAWEDYATRTLKLGPYLNCHHMQKHGLRFWFDSKEKDLPLAKMSEFGRSWYHPLTARQIDRAKFDRDLCEMNRKMGVEVLLDTKVLGGAKTFKDHIRLDGKNGHEVDTSAGTIKCKWIVDCTGRSSPLVQMLDLADEPGHPAGSYWARYSNCRNVDDLGPEAWKDRINHTERWTSTNHFMYRGYWIWVIPVTDDIISIGVVFHHDIAPMSFKNGAELEAFFRSHAAVNEIMGNAPETVDFFALKQIARISKQHFSAEDRWALSGMSGTFLDPIGSTGCWLYAEANRFAGHLIKADLYDHDAVAGRRLAKHFNLMARARFTALREVFGQTYDLYGSFDTWMPMQAGRLAAYFNRDLNDHLTDHAYFLNKIHDHGDDCGCSVEGILDTTAPLRQGLIRISREMRDYLDKRDLYNQNNAGQWEAMERWESRPSIQAKWRKPRDLEVEAGVDLETYEMAFSFLLGRMAQIEGIAFDDARFEQVFRRDFAAKQSLSDALTALRAS
ncbi:MAG: hypothetical protein NT062_28795 [Proteobacteria bacterium]|nr:hypothetical protein [Pseudomonadota bacterium]